jgi:hypothetical protein
MERVYTAACKYTEKNNLQTPTIPTYVLIMPCRQIEIIKHRIIEILPEAHFIDYNYEAQAPLDPNDFVEVYIADHKQCMSKVKETMEKMQIT